MKHISGVLEKAQIPIRPLLSRERGVTGLETAIILIAFVVVASVFAFTVLSTGIFSAEKGKEVALGGLRQASGTIELKGSVIANGVADSELDDADDAWTGVTNVTSTSDTDHKEGTGSADLSIAAAFATGVAGYETISPALDLSSHDSIQLWVKSDIATSAGDLELVIDDSTDCSVGGGANLEEIDLPALAPGDWKLATIGITDSTVRTSIACVGLRVAVDNIAAQVVNIDHVVARGQGTSLLVTIANSVGGEPADLLEPSDSNDNGIADSEDRRHKLIVTYTDQNQIVSDMAWTKSFVGNNDADDLLEVGERAELTVDLEGLAQANPLVNNTEFSLELRPNEGSALIVEKRMPAKIDVVMNLQ